MGTYIPDSSVRQQAIDTTIRGKRAATKSKVDMLGDLDDEYKSARDVGDVDALEAVAKEYAAIGCPDMASRIRFEAKYLQHSRNV